MAPLPQFTPVPCGKRSPVKSRLRHLPANDLPSSPGSGRSSEMISHQLETRVRFGKYRADPPETPRRAARSSPHGQEPSPTHRNPRALAGTLSHLQPISAQALERRLGQRNLRQPCRSRLSPPPNLRGPSPSRLSARNDFFRSYPTELSAGKNLRGTTSHGLLAPPLLRYHLAARDLSSRPFAHAEAFRISPMNPLRGHPPRVARTVTLPDQNPRCLNFRLPPSPESKPAEPCCTARSSDHPFEPVLAGWMNEHPPCASLPAPAEYTLASRPKNRFHPRETQPPKRHESRKLTGRPGPENHLVLRPRQSLHRRGIVARVRFAFAWDFPPAPGVN
jgi:hypothetical protein